MEKRKLRLIDEIINANETLIDGLYELIYGSDVWDALEKVINKNLFANFIQETAKDYFANQIRQAIDAVVDNENDKALEILEEMM